jgi:hypothetical protein
METTLTKHFVRQADGTWTEVERGARLWVEKQLRRQAFKVKTKKKETQTRFRFTENKPRWVPPDFWAEADEPEIQYPASPSQLCSTASLFWLTDDMIHRCDPDSENRFEPIRSCPPWEGEEVDWSRISRSCKTPLVSLSYRGEKKSAE